MASEIILQTVPVLSGATVKAIAFNSSGAVWSVTGSAFVAFANADIAAYAVAMTESGSTGLYVGDFPTGITTEGTYDIAVFKLAGATLVYTDEQIGSGEVNWDGTSESTPLSGDNLITLVYAKQYLKLSVTTYDALISDLIAAASDAIRNYCGRDFLTTTYTEYHSPKVPSYSLVLSQYPVNSITSVTMYPHDTTPETITGSDYAIETNTGEIGLKPTSTASSIFPSGFQTVKVIYSAGNASVPDDIQLATAMIVSNAFNQAGRDNTLNAEDIGTYSYQLRAAVSSSIVVSTEIRDLLDKHRDVVFA